MNKHQITEQTVVQLTVEEPKDVLPEGGQRVVHRGRFVRNDCDGGSCEEIDSIWVRTVIDFAESVKLNDGQQLGVVTSYCENPDGNPVCPEWVNRVSVSGGYTAFAKPKNDVVYDNAS